MRRARVIRPLLMTFAALALAGAALVGCASAQQEQIDARAYAAPQRAISAAQALGAENQPQARLYLSYAQDAVKQADVAIQHGNHDIARLALARAEADARLALTMTQQRQMATEVEEVNRRIQQLDNQLSPASGERPMEQEGPLDEQIDQPGEEGQSAPDFDQPAQP